MKPWRQQRNAATARRRSMLLQAPDAAVHEIDAMASNGRSPWEWVEWVERHDKAEQGQALAQVPKTCRHAVTRYLNLKRQRIIFEQRMNHDTEA
jgi:hypothetical protein